MQIPQSSNGGGLPRPGYPASSLMIQRMNSPTGARAPVVTSTAVNNINASPIVRTPSGLSIQKATVMTGVDLIQ